MRIDTDYLIIGSGIAGLFFALKAAERGTVALVTKRGMRESNTNYAQGGIAAVMAVEDSFDEHIRDTLDAGAGLCKEAAVEIAVREGPAVVRQLIEIGTQFTRDAAGDLSLEREGGHSRPRVVHADDLTGQEVARALVAAVKALPQVTVYEDHMAADLLLRDDGGCGGVRALDLKGGRVLDFAAPVTLLATGGAGQVYRHTTNPPVACGDGVAMAYRAGARIGNAEFIQFHPTMLYRPGSGSFLITEALRGYGAVLVDGDGAAFVERYHAAGSLATRDIVSRAIVDQMRRSGAECVFLDVTAQEAAETKRRFPNIHRHCLGLGIDITRQPIPVVPAAHYMCGGVVTDLHGATGLEGLYAAGEVACTGVHGANRLASNSLLEAMAFARRAFEDALGLRRPPGSLAVEPAAAGTAAEGLDSLRDAVRETMWGKVGIMRDDAGLEAACQKLAVYTEELEERYARCGYEPQLVETRNLATVARLVAVSARQRHESRGGHFNSDHPQRDDAGWGRDTVIGPGFEPQKER